MKVEELVADAVAQGAEIAAGGRRHQLGGSFYMPTVMTGHPQHDDCQRRGVRTGRADISFNSDDEALEIANATEFGLAAYLYTRDLGRAFVMSERLQYGMVCVNTGVISTAVAPFGGTKQSGYGRENGPYGIEEFLQTKSLQL